MRISVTVQNYSARGDLNSVLFESARSDPSHSRFRLIFRGIRPPLPVQPKAKARIQSKWDFALGNSQIHFQITLPGSAESLLERDKLEFQLRMSAGPTESALAVRDRSIFAHRGDVLAMRTR